MIFVLLAASGLATPVPPPTPTTVAVECVGTETREDIKSAPADRKAIYILRDDLRRVDLWNEDAGAEIDLCDRDEDRCEANFFPNSVNYLIHNDPSSNTYHSRLFSFDRKKGTMFLYETAYGMRIKFTAVCHKIPMPVADTTVNKF